jgi:archaemetzincin
VDVDLYSPGLNYIFGVAEPSLGMAIISLYRLKPERYGLPHNERLLQERAIKEAIHELGHTYYLSHCPDPRCVMHFSNTLVDTDKKDACFCSRCRQRLMDMESE